MTKTQKSVVILGGGTGTFVLVSGIKKLPIDITALMTMVDDGGSNKVLRDEFGLLPTSGIRQCIVALSENSTVLRELFTYRFHQGNGIKGMTFGNLFMAAMADIMGSQKKGIEETCNLLQVKGKILPISYDSVELVATYEDGSEVRGEHSIDEPHHDGTMKITQLRTEPIAQLSDEAREAILHADLIIIGPGDFYTNTIANFVVKGVPEAIAQSTGKVCFISNLMAKYGETYGYSLKDFLADLKAYFPLEEIDYFVINSNNNYPLDLLRLYEKALDMPVLDNITEKDIHPGVKIIRQDLASDVLPKKQQGDTLIRSMVRHSPKKLAKMVETILDDIK